MHGPGPDLVVAVLEREEMEERRGARGARILLHGQGILHGLNIEAMSVETSETETDENMLHHQRRSRYTGKNTWRPATNDTP